MLFLLFFYLSLKRIYPNKQEIAIIGLALTAFSPYLIYYSQEARHYSLFLFLYGIGFKNFIIHIGKFFIYIYSFIFVINSSDIFNNNQQRKIK